MSEPSAVVVPRLLIRAVLSEQWRMRWLWASNNCSGKNDCHLCLHVQLVPFYACLALGKYALFVCVTFMCVNCVHLGKLLTFMMWKFSHLLHWLVPPSLSAASLVSVGSWVPCIFFRITWVTFCTKCTNLWHCRFKTEHFSGTKLVLAAIHKSRQLQTSGTSASVSDCECWYDNWQLICSPIVSF